MVMVVVKIIVSVMETIILDTTQNPNPVMSYITQTILMIQLKTAADRNNNITKYAVRLDVS